jgi:hypothetical protein
MIRFLPGTSNGFDLNYDATKLFSQGSEVPQICTQSVKVNLAINTLPVLEDELMVPLSFQCKTAGYYTLEINKVTNLDLLISVYLKDELEQRIINLSRNLSYGFYHDPMNAKDRFKIYFNPSEDVINNLNPDDYFSVYANSGRITLIKNTIKDLTGEIWIYNTMGQAVYRTTLTNDKTCSYNLNLASGYYYVNIRTQNQLSNYKIFINN